MEQYDYTESVCRNCGTRRYEAKFDGYCKRCAYKARKLARLLAGTWKGRGRYPKLDEHGRLWAIWNTEMELKTLRILEEPLSRNTIDPLEIADLLFSIVNAARAKPDSWSNLGGLFYNIVPSERNPDVYRFLYTVLLEVVETLPQRKYRCPSSTLWWWPNHPRGSDFEQFDEWKKRQSPLRSSQSARKDEA